MKLLSFGPERATPISEYHSLEASAVALAGGQGETHAYCLHLGAGGEIGAHDDNVRMTTTLRRSRRGVLFLVNLLLVPVPAMAAQSPAVADPVRSFVQGFNPTDEDFFARSPQETILLRMRLDLDGDGQSDLALSESSVIGNGGGPWLVFRRSSTSGYRYVGEIFAAPGDLRIERDDRGAVLVAGSALSADLTRLVRYRVNT
ncbi:MAG TPA: hypothetical protein VIM84_04010, partial [Gemmatimonadales bacterium]